MTELEKTKYEQDVKLQDLKPGDKVILRHSGTVTSVNTDTGHVRLSDGARIRMTLGCWNGVSNGTLFTADREVKAGHEFLAGQVWKDGAGIKYMILGGSGGL